MKTKLLVIGAISIIACGANAAPKKAAEIWSGQVSYYTYGADQTYFGEQVYYGEEDYRPEIVSAMYEKYNVNLGIIMGMCSKTGGIVSLSEKYSNNDKQPQSHKKGEYCWCKAQNNDTDDFTPWFLFGHVSGTGDGIKNYCARTCAFKCATEMHSLLYPPEQDGYRLIIENARGLIEALAK